MEQLQILQRKSSELLLSSELPVAANLLRLAEIDFVDDKSISSCSMQIDPKSGSAKLKLNINFVSQFCEKPVRFATLICHEIMHHMFDHYVVQEDITQRDLVEDIVINSYINRTSPGFSQLFNDLYEKTSFPSMILRPGGSARRVKNAYIQNLVISIQSQFWPRFSHKTCVMSIPELSTILDDIRTAALNIKEANIKSQRPPYEGLEGLEIDWIEQSDLHLIGDHENKTETFAEHDNPEMDIGKILDGLTRDLSCGNGGSFFTQLFEIEKEIPPDEMAKALEEAMRKDILLRQEMIECIVGPDLNDESPIPYYIGRKESIMLANRWYPRSYPTHGPGEDIDASGEVRIYLDVSGSMGNSCKFLLMLLTGFKNRVANELYEFSTMISPINFGDLVEKFEETGELFIQTTGGTNFDPIFEHAREQGFEKILIITDGQAAITKEENRIFASSIETYTLFTENHNSVPLTDVSRKTWVMPVLKVPENMK